MLAIEDWAAAANSMAQANDLIAGRIAALFFIMIGSWGLFERVQANSIALGIADDGDEAVIADIGFWLEQLAAMGECLSDLI
jgi:hypothetical protein